LSFHAATSTPQNCLILSKRKLLAIRQD